MSSIHPKQATLEEFAREMQKHKGNAARMSMEFEAWVKENVVNDRKACCPKGHKLELKGKQAAGWYCNGFDEYPGCWGCSEKHLSSNLNRWRCSEGCDFDYCEGCYHVGLPWKWDTTTFVDCFSDFNNDAVLDSCVSYFANAFIPNRAWCSVSDVTALIKLTNNDTLQAKWCKILAPMTKKSVSHHGISGESNFDLGDWGKEIGNSILKREVEELDIQNRARYAKYDNFSAASDSDSDDGNGGRRPTVQKGKGRSKKGGFHITVSFNGGGGAHNNNHQQQNDAMLLQQQMLLNQQTAMLMATQNPMMLLQQQQQQQYQTQNVAPVGPPQNAAEVSIAGYGDFDKMTLDTENTSMPIQAQAPPEILQFNISSDVKPKTRDESRAELLKYIDDTVCWGSKPAKEGNIDSCVGLASFHCKVETFVEYRTSARVHRPYHRGTPYSSPAEGRAPQPWQMQCAPQPFFRDSVEKQEIPFTSSIATCFNCSGTGRVRCDPCRGDGKKSCGSCGGDGRVRHTRTDQHGKQHVDHKDCNNCHATGKVKCNNCGGDGKVTCKTCDGTGQIRYFLQMTRTHRTLVNERVVKETIPDADLPDKKIQEAKGTTVLDKQGVNLAPPKGFNDLVDKALVEIDQGAADQLKGLNGYQHQEHIVLKSVPVTLTKATMDGDKFRWYIYGLDNRIEICEYPATMCCGLCNIA